MLMYTLENDRCDSIRKENGIWHFSRVGEPTIFNNYEDAVNAISEIEKQGHYVGDVKIY